MGAVQGVPRSGCFVGFWGSAALGPCGWCRTCVTQEHEDSWGQLDLPAEAPRPLSLSGACWCGRAPRTPEEGSAESGSVQEEPSEVRRGVRTGSRMSLLVITTVCTRFGYFEWTCSHRQPPARPRAPLHERVERLVTRPRAQAGKRQGNIANHGGGASRPHAPLPAPPRCTPSSPPAGLTPSPRPGGSPRGPGRRRLRVRQRQKDAGWSRALCLSRDPAASGARSQGRAA